MTTPATITFPARIPDQSGRCWLITGATRGIGRETARAAARAGARLILPARSAERAAELADQLRKTGVQISTPHLDLADLSSVRALPEQVDGAIDVLIDNAGAVTARRRETVDGFELMLGTNFLGPFALTNLLAGRVRDRVVIVGSNAHHGGRVDAADPHFRHRRWSIGAAYAQSKLCDMLWARALQQRLHGDDGDSDDNGGDGGGGGPDVQLAHPGWAYTDLQNATGVEVLDRGISAICRRLGQPAAQGALPVLAAATAQLPALSYLGPSGFRHLRGEPSLEQPSALALDDDAARAVWRLGVDQTGTDLPAGA